MPTVSLAIPPEFSFDECLRYLNRSKIESLHAVESGHVKKVIGCVGTPVFLKVGCTSPRTLEIEYQADTNTEALEQQVLEYVADWFDLQTDLRPFYSMAQQDPLLAPVIEQHFGLRLIGITDLFEAFCWAIIGQQINLGFAYTLKKRFVETFGKCHIDQELKLYLFPTPEIIASCSPDQLTALQFSSRKAAYIIGIAQAMADQSLTKPMLQALPEAEARETLVQYRGVGYWTADYVLLKCLKHPDAFPAQDVGLHNALKQLLHLPHKPDLPVVHQYAEKWRGWRGYATFYLWQTSLF